MTPPRLLLPLAVLLAGSPLIAENPRDKPLSENELLHQIETLNPDKAPATGTASANPLFNAPGAGGDFIKPPTDRGAADPAGKGDKKAKGPTEITALEATFDQRQNLAVFIGDVVVKDPEFNVVCDKLIAHLKHEEKSAAKPAGAKPATPHADSAASKKKSGGGLESATAITTSDRRVLITQDKVEADGTVTHGIGRADRADYDAITGNVTLIGNPDVIQGINRCIATAPTTVITLNRDGNMTAKGPHRTIISEDTTRDTSKGASQ